MREIETVHIIQTSYLQPLGRPSAPCCSWYHTCCSSQNQ